MEDLQAWNQDTMRAYQQNEMRVLQAGTTVMVDRVQGDLTVFRVGKNATELYALTSDLK
jgi:cold shock CspA family protein